jgi:hypothetical protein
MGSPTEFLTLNTSEFPNAAAASSLSDILVTGDVPQRYFLSAKACSGILRRAARRRKKLPEQLERALKALSDKEELSPTPQLPEPSQQLTPIQAKMQTGTCSFQLPTEVTIDPVPSTSLPPATPQDRGEWTSQAKP